MGKILETKITDFSGGMVSNPRLGNFKYAQLIKNFDIHTYPGRLVPFRDMEDGDSSASTHKIQNFAVALRTGTTYSLYGLGVTSGTNKAEIYYKDLTTNSTTDMTDALWTETANNADTTGTATAFDLFVYYNRTGLIYGARDGTHIWAYDPSASAGFDATENAVAYTSIRQGIVHSKDNILYIPYYNTAGGAYAKSYIMTFDGTTWTNTALALPDHYIVNSICEYGDFLAIGVAPISGYGNSRVYIWDRDSTLTTLTESVDWGDGSLSILEEIEGQLIGISSVGYPNSFKGKVVFRNYSGDTVSIFNQLYLASGVYFPVKQKYKINQFLYFQLTSTLNGATHRGICKVGREMPGQPFSVTWDRYAFNDATATPVQGFCIVDDFVLVSYTNEAGSTYSMSKTHDDNSVAYTATSVYESLIWKGTDSRYQKKLLGVTVTTDYLPADGQVVLKYQINENIGGTSWVTIFTNTTDDSISHSAINIESTGAALPEFKEIVFRIESTGNAVITGLEFKADEVGGDTYA